MLTIKQLKEKLNDYPDNMVVVMANYDFGLYHDLNIIDINTIELIRGNYRNVYKANKTNKKRKECLCMNELL